MVCKMKGIEQSDGVDNPDERILVSTTQFVDSALVSGLRRVTALQLMEKKDLGLSNGGKFEGANRSLHLISN